MDSREIMDMDEKLGEVMVEKDTWKISSVICPRYGQVFLGCHVVSISSQTKFRHLNKTKTSFF
jgi:hypothetical protein